MKFKTADVLPTARKTFNTDSAL